MHGAKLATLGFPDMLLSAAASAPNPQVDALPLDTDFKVWCRTLEGAVNTGFDRPAVGLVCTAGLTLHATRAWLIPGCFA
jgi:hypothetical protein